MNLPVETDLTMMQLYPHSKKPLHYAMGLVTAIIFVPAGYIAFPLLLALKLVLYPLPYLALSLLPDRAAGRMWELKNRVFSPVHYVVYKLYYIHIGLWLSCFNDYDDHWYGLDTISYRDHEDYLTSYRDSRVRWRFKKKLKTYGAYGITEEIIPDYAVFFKSLFSIGFFRLIYRSNFRKNRGFALLFGHYLVMRDYFIILFLPVRMHVYSKDGAVAGIATYLKRGNTLVMCQHIISDEYIRSGMFYSQMDTCIGYAFRDPDVRYVSCSITTRQAKQTCGCYPINYLLTDEFRFLPFTQLGSP
ncbi:MAG: hypothetical protein KA369_19535 [Spirochaetes bacterium]|nr:hypothetical protein [Spirochaetota bacterium]